MVAEMQPAQDQEITQVSVTIDVLAKDGTEEPNDRRDAPDAETSPSDVVTKDEPAEAGSGLQGCVRRVRRRSWCLCLLYGNEGVLV